MKQQVVVIHGGEAYTSYKQYITDLKDKPYFTSSYNRGWKANLQRDLGSRYEVIMPRMPSPQNAKYREWKIWFEKVIITLREDVILVGHSLGGIFLVKYLLENRFPVRVRGLFLVAAPFSISSSPIGDFHLSDRLLGVIKNGGEKFLYYSSDDFIVPVVDGYKYLDRLPFAKLRLFKRKGHFLQEGFPQLVKDIKSLH